MIKKDVIHYTFCVEGKFSATRIGDDWEVWFNNEGSYGGDSISFHLPHRRFIQLLGYMAELSRSESLADGR